MGYFAYDLVVMLAVVGDRSIVTKQLIVHHIISSLTFTFSFVEGRHLVSMSQSVMLCELSTLFLNIRFNMGKKAEGLFPFINSVCLFLSFTFTRILWFPLLINAHFYASLMLYNPFAQSWVHILAWIIVTLSFTSVFLLNLYWYQFLVKGFSNILFQDKDHFKKVKTDKYGVNIDDIEEN